MNKDICKYINNEKAKTQVYPLQMTDIPDRPFDKIAIDLVRGCNISTSGNQHTLTITAHLTGWLDAFQIPDKKSDTTVHVLINNNLPVHRCPCFTLSDNGTEFKNQLMDNIIQQVGIDNILSAPYHPQRNGKLEVFHKYLKPTPTKLCKNDPANWDKYINQVLASYCLIPHLATAETPFFLVYGRDPNLPLHQLQGLDLESHHIALAIAKKTLDENRFKHAQKTRDCTPPNFKLVAGYNSKTSNLENRI